MAPSDGQVVSRFANSREMIGAGTPVLAVVENSWLLRTWIFDSEAVLLKLKSAATIYLDAFPNEIFPASVIAFQRKPVQF